MLLHTVAAAEQVDQPAYPCRGCIVYRLRQCPAKGAASPVDENDTVGRRIARGQATEQSDATIGGCGSRRILNGRGQEGGRDRMQLRRWHRRSVRSSGWPCSDDLSVGLRLV